ncbi:MAG: PQQ-dependent sugar dehydrogenase [Aquabacterium sp.]
MLRMTAHLPRIDALSGRRPARTMAGLLTSCLLAGLAACGGGDTPPVARPSQTASGTPPSIPDPGPGETPSSIQATTLVSGLASPWALAFLPDGSMLVTERAGRMRRVRLSDTGPATLTDIAGVPAVFASGQGGLLDVVVDPASDPAEPWIYWSYSEPGSGAEAGKSGTAVARARLVGQELKDIGVIFRQTPKVDGDGHYGSRLVWDRAGSTLFITLGERQRDSTTNPTLDNAQNLQKTLGKVVRINRDGSPAAANPTWPTSGADSRIWSLGHRNPQGAALHPVTGELWVSEHGPQGGDEINIARAGQNHGWPLRSYGCPYEVVVVTDACRIGGGTHAPDFIEPLTYWPAPSIAPSGMAFYTSDKLPGWQGSLFIGALAGQALWRITLDGDRVVGREALYRGTFGRIRDVRQGPDGWLYLLTDSSNGQIIRLAR